MSYIELQATTNYCFHRGASHPKELFGQAKQFGMPALGITDRNSLAGIVRAYAAAKECQMQLIVGVRLDLRDGASVLIYPTDKAAYSRLCRLLTVGKRRAEKGECHLDWADVFEYSAGLIAIYLPDKIDHKLKSDLIHLKQNFGDRAYLALTLRRRPQDALRLHKLNNLGTVLRIPTVVTNDVLYHMPERRFLQDVVSCIREGTTIDDLGFKRERFAERYLKPPEEMQRLFRDYPEAIKRTEEIAKRSIFSFDQLEYHYPTENCLPGQTAQEALTHFTWEGAAKRYTKNLPEKIRKQLIHELALIDELQYAPYFLTVYHIVNYAKSQGILCQGRGSAANSAVCYVLGITSVDPDKSNLMFERFISRERREPPDIDIDFEHERREQVIQWVFDTYGRDHAALTAVVSSYCSRGAIRDVGKAMNLTEDVIQAIQNEVSDIHGKFHQGLSDGTVDIKAKEPRIRQAIALALELQRFPSHMSQHPGGFVLTQGRLDDLIPIEPARMADRQIIELDKTDIDVLKFMKVDLLGLGMLGCLNRCFNLLRQHKNIEWDLATVPDEDTATYDMLCKADTVGTFQVESRAQMSMLPRLKPRCFFDLVIEVSLVRPGPIQGGMVHPLLLRREGREPIPNLPPELDAILGNTLGVPIFQEQIMGLAILAGFTPGESDALRREMATFKDTEGVGRFKDKFINGLIAKNFNSDFARRCWKQVEGFGSYGFPMSHAFAFARIAYASCVIKCHHPDIFCCAILNAYPMGFYAPAQLVSDAKAHGIDIRPVDINFSAWECTLEKTDEEKFAVRLGFNHVSGMKETEITKLSTARDDGLFYSVCDFLNRSGMSSSSLDILAGANAFTSLGLARRNALWALKGQTAKRLPLWEAADKNGTFLECLEPLVVLPPMTKVMHVVADYKTLGLSLQGHPIEFVRDHLKTRGVIAARSLPTIKSGSRVILAGVVLVRQRPGTSKGVIFMTIEDETANANIIVWPTIKDKFRTEVLTSSLLVVTGKVQHEGNVIHLIAEQFVELGAFLPVRQPLFDDMLSGAEYIVKQFQARSRDFC